MFSNQMNNGSLFELETVNFPEVTTRENAGKRLVGKLNKIRRSLSPAESEFDNYLKSVVREIKTVSALSDDERREMVLFCLEKSHAHTVAEISGDTHLSESAVKILIEQLLKENLIQMVERLTIGGSANQTLIFSKRKPCSCV